MKIKVMRNSLFLVVVLLAFAGCNSTFQNFTPERIPQNPSGIYSFSFSAEIPSSNRVEGSERAQIAINGQTYDMTRSPTDDLTFTYDYKMPPGVAEARYYYILSWDYSAAGSTKTVTRFSTVENGQVFHARLVNHYPIQLVNDRGPAGSSIPIVGNGFTSQDEVFVGSTEALTTVHSPNSLEFVVPPLPAGQTYNVLLRTGGGDLNAGHFQVDEAVFSVQPQALSLTSGQADFLIVELDNTSPLGGLHIDAQTDIPGSIIMPEILIPEGARSVNVKVRGGSPGTGVLVLSAPGYAPVEIPVTVN